MPPRDWRLRIEDILDALDRVERYTAVMDLSLASTRNEPRLVEPALAVTAL